MSTSILSRVISVTDKRIVLSNSHAAIKLDHVLINNNTWSNIRIGCRIQMGDTGADITGTPKFFFGLLSNPSAGMANGPLGTSTSHFFGIDTDNATWIRGSNAYTQTSFHVGTKVGTTESLAVDSNFDDFAIGYSLSTVRNALVIDFSRPSAWSANVVHPYNDTTAAIDISQAQLLESMILSPLTAAGTLFGYGTSTALSNVGRTVDEGTNGQLNSICMGWDRSSAVMEFSDIVYAVLS